MHKIFLLLAVIGIGVAQAAQADTLTVPDPATTSRDVPQRGMSQSAVVKLFGQPLERHAPVGGGNPKRPPITRWDYDGYSVFFEKNLVIDTVIKDAPVPVHHMDELQKNP